MDRRVARSTTCAATRTAARQPVRRRTTPDRGDPGSRRGGDRAEVTPIPLARRWQRLTGGHGRRSLHPARVAFLETLPDDKFAHLALVVHGDVYLHVAQDKVSRSHGDELDLRNAIGPHEQFSLAQEQVI